ncbi:pheromone-processing carboxypeptidase KEX1-like [Papaver somniferum]|uniref:pheromone-processing carboxypeptidase KEX1-like n=1 Tax=Papaver somniferum TaxID=3469 RepID=UPI000E6FC427|nr:pheromone-processing carboxypeptidase KEX1-like [Papaver somniferum]
MVTSSSISVIPCFWFHTMVTSTSSSSDYDHEYSSSSSDEDSKVPEMKISTAESRAKMDHSAEMKCGVPLNNRRVTREELLKRKAEDDIDPDIHSDFVNRPNNDSDDEFEEDSAKDDDDESDNSDKSDDSDESDD